MAVQYVGYYIASCSGCGWWGDRHRQRGQALQDELDHHRVVPEGACECPIIGSHQHHLTGCEPCRGRQAAASSGTDSEPATS